MTRFARYCGLNLALLTFLALMVIFVTPDILPGDPPPDPVDRAREWFVYPFDLLLLAYIFPVLLGSAHSGLVNSILLLLTLAFWSGVCVCLHGMWRQHHPQCLTAPSGKPLVGGPEINPPDKKLPGYNY